MKLDKLKKFVSDKERSSVLAIRHVSWIKLVFFKACTFRSFHEFNLFLVNEASFRVTTYRGASSRAVFDQFYDYTKLIAISLRLGRAISLLEAPLRSNHSSIYYVVVLRFFQPIVCTPKKSRSPRQCRVANGWLMRSFLVNLVSVICFSFEDDKISRLLATRSVFIFSAKGTLHTTRVFSPSLIVDTLSFRTRGCVTVVSHCVKSKVQEEETKTSSAARVRSHF